MRPKSFYLISLMVSDFGATIKNGCEISSEFFVKCLQIISKVLNNDQHDKDINYIFGIWFSLIYFYS